MSRNQMQSIKLDKSNKLCPILSDQIHTDLLETLW